MSPSIRMQPTAPNWPHLLSCCAFAVPVGVAVVQIYHDVVRASVFEWGWSIVASSLVLHSMVAVLSAAGFLLIADRWREFYGLKSALQWLTLGGCWLAVILGFVLCMTLT